MRKFLANHLSIVALFVLLFAVIVILLTSTPAESMGRLSPSEVSLAEIEQDYWWEEANVLLSDNVSPLESVLAEPDYPGKPAIIQVGETIVKPQPIYWIG